MAIKNFSKMTERGRSYDYFSKTFDFSQIFEISREKKCTPHSAFFEVLQDVKPNDILYVYKLEHKLVAKTKIFEIDSKWKEL